ncbi:MAG: glycosyltransferase [Gammaproteobacteria bacterium]
MPVEYSVIIPAFNEERLLPGTLARLNDAMSGIDLAGEIIVVDNNSSDGTAGIARAHKARLVFEPVNQISRARNTGARIANGRYLIFVDADTMVSQVLLMTALQSLEAGTCCGGGVRVAGDRSPSRIMHYAMELWNILSVQFGWAAGCFIYCLREGFEAIGGFSEKVYASEEIWLSRRLRSWGKKRGLAFEIITDPPAITSMRKLDWYTPAQLLLLTIPVLLFPPAVRFRVFCLPWYRRPHEKGRNTGNRH